MSVEKLFMKSATSVRRFPDSAHPAQFSVPRTGSLRGLCGCNSDSAGRYFQQGKGMATRLGCRPSCQRRGQDHVRQTRRLSAIQTPVAVSSPVTPEAPTRRLNRNSTVPRRVCTLGAYIPPRALPAVCRCAIEGKTRERWLHLAELIAKEQDQKVLALMLELNQVWE